MLKTIWQGFCDLVYPPVCPVCYQHSHSPNCNPERCHFFFQYIRFNTKPACPRCMRPHNYRQANQYMCVCQRQRLAFDFVWSACLYHGRLRELLHLFKYKHQTGLKVLFAQWMQACILKHRLDIHQFDLIIPIPLHPVKHRERGYNQAELLALELKKLYNIDINTHILYKIRNTNPHAQLGKKERWTNIQGAFTIKRSEDIRGKSILLVDDLFTTGATAQEAAKTLKHYGASQVGVFCLAIAP